MFRSKCKQIPCAFLLLLLAFACAASSSAYAELRVSHLLSDHMVIQRDLPIHVWGWADPGSQIKVVLHHSTRTATVDSLGEWSVYLPPEIAGGPYELSITDGGQEKILLSDVLIGDVWIASGQSNMEMPMKGFPNDPVKNGPQEIAQANNPNIRLLRIGYHSSEHPVHSIDESWQQCTPSTVQDFSAVAYFFGQSIQQQEHVPIGLIDTTWGGTPASSWISLDSLSADASLMPVFAVRAETVDDLEQQREAIAQQKRQDAIDLANNKKVTVRPWQPDPDNLALAWRPSGLYNGMIAPLTEYGIKGVIWYQGESDAGPHRVGSYQRAFESLISDWRSKWKQGDFPFVYAQISSFTSAPSENYGMIRDVQRRVLSVANVAMAVTLDKGEADRVHPADKLTVGERLALGARALAYKEANLEYSGPLFRQATQEGSSIRVWFEHASGLASRAGGPVEGFEVAGSDHQFHTANARIERDTVLVSSSEVQSPEFVRYAWANYPKASLFNGAGLPASTFTSEELIGTSYR